MGETFERIPLEAEGENYGEDPSSPGKLRKVIPLQNFLKNSEGSGNLEVVMEQELYLEKFGYVNVVLVRDCLSWQLVDSDDLIGTSCWGGRKDLEKSRDQVLVSEIFAVEYSGLSNPASIGMCGPFTNPLPQMHRFAVHTFLRAQSNKCNWTPKVHTFCHASAEICQSWVDRIQGLIDRDLSRPKNLLVLINPYGGKKAGVRQWETVAPLFHKAGVKTKVLLTERAQHAYDLMAQSTEEELKNLDGVIVVGGDGLFNEVLNGLVMHRHKGHPAPNPERVLDLMAKRWKTKKRNNSSSHLPSEEGLRALSNMERKNDQSSGPSFDVHSPLLTDSPLESRAVSYYSAPSSSSSSPDSSINKSLKSRMDQQAVVYAMPSKEIELTTRDSFDSSIAITSEAEPLRVGADSTFLPAASKDVVGSASTRDPGKLQYSGSNRHKTNAPLRIGIIPAGSTDTVAISTTGSRDPVTAALHVLLGDSMPLDIVKITGWKKTPQSVDEPPRVRYAASFAGYGFYGDVMRESENARWLGPARYDIAGVKVFLKHKTYQAEVSYLDIPQIPAGLKNLTPRNGSSENSKLTDRAHRVICRVNCGICAQGMDLNHLVDSDSEEEELEEASAELQATKPRWRSLRGSFHSVGGAVMSCRNDKAPDGLAAHAHLADGLLHLILIRKCSRPSYLRQLISLTRRGADPFNFDFVEHYKTPVFTFTSVGEESIWNIDGELFPAHQLTAQVARGLVNIYARGPED
ncbi:ceramide kinase [Marchantia polymorpha subsp. ruderalis]|nr:hypothetical protein MARPO_0032s0128 [Marchantia polymorpha]BBN11744.1 hypothetical protein Mp_5g14360 [Marchantia polymorpha subsp. ruderalis]|eukprot:PTQ41962.1 hypothetical protein MARPO_0032s0128 [Marchantia polymorpha]